MLINFSFENFKSYRDEQQFSMLRPVSAQKHDGGSWPRKEISTVAGIYGGNASGKSAFLEAFCFVADYVIDGFDPNYDISDHMQPFRLDKASRLQATRFLVDFYGTDDKRYLLEFTLQEGKVAYESLRVYNGNRNTRLYERELVGESYTYRYGRPFTGAKKTFEQMTRPGVLYFSVLFAANSPLVIPAYDFFKTRIGFYKANLFDCELRNIRKELKKGTLAAKVLADLMSKTDLGISVVQTKDLLSELQKTSQHPDDPREGGFEELASGLLALSEPDLTKEERRNKAHRLAKQPLEPEYEFSFTHKGSGGFEETFNEDEESEGTLAVLAFFSLALRLLSRRAVGFIDEIDSSLHPNYVQELVALFKDPNTNPNQSQLIFTTHDVSLITRTGADVRVLDQDQIWLVEKGRDGSSSLYPVTSIPSRWDENFGRNYLHGVYGAAPRPEFHEAFISATEQMREANLDFTAEDFGGEA